MLKISEIRALSYEDILKQLEEAHQELFNLRFRLATRQLVNYCEIPRVRKNIARLKTILSERDLGIEHAARSENGERGLS